MKNNLNFETALLNEILGNLSNDYDDNYDHYRFGEPHKQKTVKSILKKRVLKLLKKKDFHRQTDKNYSNLRAELTHIDKYIAGLKSLFYNLSDQESKLLLLKIIAYRILGYKKVKLPLNIKGYWEAIKAIETDIDFNDSIPIAFMDSKLYLIDLNKRGIPIKLYFSAVGVYIDFVLKQYEYKTLSKTIKVKKGDYVIDAGGCYGDTALYFANEVGDNGKVFTYEFIPSNLNLLYKNLSLNTKLQERINIIEKPVWEVSDLPMHFIDNGPGSKVFMDVNEKHDGQVTSLSIDDLIQLNNILKVDFIKMDIEGAELSALKGAVKTIKKFRPTLAIAIYHSWDDFVNIPEYIRSLNLDYKLYLGHYTINAEETIIFAEPVND